MNPLRLGVPVAVPAVARAGVRTALLAATLLFGSACVVGSGEPIDELDDTAETDDPLQGASGDQVADLVSDDGTWDDGVVDEADGWSDEREEQQIVLPSVLVSEPEPDPWDDPMKSGHDGNGSGNKD